MFLVQWMAPYDQTDALTRETMRDGLLMEKTISVQQSLLQRRLVFTFQQVHLSAHTVSAADHNAILIDGFTLRQSPKICSQGYVLRLVQEYLSHQMSSGFLCVWVVIV